MEKHGNSLTLYFRESSAEISGNWDKYPFRVRLLNGEIMVTAIIFDESNSHNKKLNLYDRIIEVNEAPVNNLSGNPCEHYDILTKMFSKQSVKKIKFISPEGKEIIWESDY